jgi:uncharacterized small protein (DUF1192 family)
MASFFDGRNYEAFCEHVAKIEDLGMLKLAVIDLATYLRDAFVNGVECTIDSGRVFQELTLQVQGMVARIELMRDIIDRLEAEGVLYRKAN